MSVPMPAVLVLIVCKVVLGAPDDNSSFTKWRSSEPDMTQGVMHCRRMEVSLYDPSVDQGAAERPFTPEACKRTAMTLGPQYDVDHVDDPWRFWRSACPVPTINEITGEIIAWTLPPCPESNGTVICEMDSVI